MILTWTDLQTFYKAQINDDTSTALTVGKMYMNIAYNSLLKSNKWTFLEKEKTIKTVVAQRTYELPNSVDKLMEGVKMTIGSQDYPIYEVKSREDWNILISNNYSSDIPTHFFISDDTISFFPTPTVVDYNITLPFQTKIKKLSIEDVALSGTFTLVNGSTAIVASASLFTKAMEGRFIFFDELAVGGDGMGYEIETFLTATTATLRKPYEGASCTTQTITGKIGQCPIIPEGYQQIIPFEAIIIQNYQKDPQKYQYAVAQRDKLYADMKSYFQSKTTKITTSGRRLRAYNPNHNLLRTSNNP